MEQTNANGIAQQNRAPYFTCMRHNDVKRDKWRRQSVREHSDTHGRLISQQFEQLFWIWTQCELPEEIKRMCIVYVRLHGVASEYSPGSVNSFWNCISLALLGISTIRSFIPSHFSFSHLQQIPYRASPFFFFSPSPSYIVYISWFISSNDSSLRCVKNITTKNFSFFFCSLLVVKHTEIDLRATLKVFKVILR